MRHLGLVYGVAVDPCKIDVRGFDSLQVHQLSSLTILPQVRNCERRDSVTEHRSSVIRQSPDERDPEVGSKNPALCGIVSEDSYGGLG